jgi:hypothetical protein
MTPGTSASRNKEDDHAGTVPTDTAPPTRIAAFDGSGVPGMQLSLCFGQAATLLLAGTRAGAEA